jgi:hypothetical protein
MCIFSWSGFHDISSAAWENYENVIDHVDESCENLQAITSMIMLASWEIWKKRNARIFQHRARRSNVAIDNVKVEARIWYVAGGKYLSNMMRGE